MADVDAAYDGGTPAPETYTGFDVAADEAAARATEAYDEAKAWYEGAYVERFLAALEGLGFFDM